MIKKEKILNKRPQRRQLSDMILDDMSSKIIDRQVLEIFVFIRVLIKFNLNKKL